MHHIVLVSQIRHDELKTGWFNRLCRGPSLQVFRYDFCLCFDDGTMLLLVHNYFWM